MGICTLRDPLMHVPGAYQMQCRLCQTANHMMTRSLIVPSRAIADMSYHAVATQYRKPLFRANAIVFSQRLAPLEWAELFGLDISFKASISNRSKT